MNKSQRTIKLSSSLSQDIMKNCVNYIRTDIIMVDCHCQKVCHRDLPEIHCSSNFFSEKTKCKQVSQ